jgi:stromal membrane-associated protein
MNRKSAVSEDQHAHHRQILKGLLSDPSLGNKACADCHGRQPTWASVNLGVFVCLTCSGIHRSLGVHVSQVRSTTLDTWTPEQVEFMVRARGNDACNAFWEAQLGKHFVRPDGSNVHELKRFITDKYVNRKYLENGVRDTVRSMQWDEFGTYYSRRAGAGEIAAHEPLRPTSPAGNGSQNAPITQKASMLVDDSLLLDLTDDTPKPDSALARPGSVPVEQPKEDDMWGDIEWVTTEAPCVDGDGRRKKEEKNRHLRQEIDETGVRDQGQASMPGEASGSVKKKSNFDDIMALFDS